jgi:hypothetical protein
MSTTIRHGNVRTQEQLEITCAGCGAVPCRCLWRLAYDGEIDLIRRVARGEVTAADCQAWLHEQDALCAELHRQREEDEAEMSRAVEALRRRDGGRSGFGPMNALQYLMGRNGFALCRGSDDDVWMQIRRDSLGLSVRLELIRWAREWIRDEWGRGDLAATVLRHKARAAAIFSYEVTQ